MSPHSKHGVQDSFQKYICGDQHRGLDSKNQSSKMSRLESESPDLIGIMQTRILCSRKEQHSNLDLLLAVMADS